MNIHYQAIAALPKSPRIEFLKKKMLDEPRYVSIEQARIITGAELAVDGGSMAQFVYEEEGIKLSDGTVIAD